MLPIYQNRYGEHENCKGSKYNVSAYMRFLQGALQLSYTYKLHILYSFTDKLKENNAILYCSFQ